MKHPLKEIGLFIAIVPAFSVWVPLLVFLLSAITQAESGLALLFHWYGAGESLMGFLGYTDQDLTSGGSFMSLPSDLALTGVLTIYTVIGLMMWVLSLCIRNMLKKPLWPE